jgi:hypothetical protein
MKKGIFTILLGAFLFGFSGLTFSQRTSNYPHLTAIYTRTLVDQLLVFLKYHRY